MGMVAQHMLRAPQLRYRLDMERRKLDNDTMVSRAQAGNYDAQTAKHGEDARGQQQRNEAFARIRDGGGARIAAMMSGQMPKDEAVMNQDIADAAMAWNISGADAMKVFQAAGQSKMATKGVPTSQIGRTVGNITSQVNNEADNAAMANRGYSLGPGSRRYNADGSMQVENPSASSQARQYPEEIQKWLNSAQAEHAKAIADGQMEKANRIAASIDATRKKWASPQAEKFNQITDPAAAATTAAPQAEQGDFVQPQDPDDSDTPENRAAAASPQNKVDALIREAQKAIRLGADQAAVIKRAKDLHGVTLTVK